MGAAHRDIAVTSKAGASNAKIVFSVSSGVVERREALIAADVPMRALKRFDGFGYTLCDGEDPEGNVFQLSQAD